MLIESRANIPDFDESKKKNSYLQKNRQELIRQNILPRGNLMTKERKKYLSFKIYE